MYILRSSLMSSLKFSDALSLSSRIVVAFVLVVATSFSSNIEAQSAGHCIDTPPLNDDWGWNYSLEASCRLSESSPNGSSGCVDTEPFDDDWGWNYSLEESCRLSESSSTGSSGCIDTEPFDDDWGWNYSLKVSCRLSESSTSGSSGCIDTEPFDDDWGWNYSLEVSCRLSESASSETTQDLESEQDRQSDDGSEDIDGNGDEGPDGVGDGSPPPEDTTDEEDTTDDTVSAAPSSYSDVCITEFMADNDVTLADADGDYSDWIELHNAGSGDIDLDGWCLTDNSSQWCFTGGTLAAQQYLVVFASDKDRQDTLEPHTNFKLSKGGEYLALVSPDGVPVCAFTPEFPRQVSDLSYGDDGNQTGYFEFPTPGAPNSTSARHAPQVAPVDAIEMNTFETLELSLSASDADLDPLQWSADSLPAWVVLTDNGDGTATLVLMPQAEESGQIELTVFDGLLKTTVEVDYEVSALGTPPVDTMAELDISWGADPIIVDAANQRLLISLDQSFSTTQTHSAPLQYFPSAPHRTLSIDSQPVAPGELLTLSISHGESLPVQFTQNGVVTDNFRLVATNLPLFQIDVAEIVDEPKLPGTMRWVDGDLDFDSGVRNLGIEWRGQTSQLLPKKSYGFEVREDSNPEEGDNIRLLGLRNDDDWIADAAYRDQTLVRNLVSHDLWRAMRPYAYLNEEGEEKGQATIAGALAELVLNGSYQGTYVVEERVDRKLLALEKIKVPKDGNGSRWDLIDFSDPANGSLLYKAEGNLANFYRPDLTLTEFEQKYPDPDDERERYEPLIDLIRFVNDSTDATFIDQIEDLVDLDSLVDFWILRMVTSNADTFKKNYYVARNRSQRWLFVPWDFDATFGMRWTGAPNPNSVRFFNPEQHALVGRLSAIPETGFNERVLQQWNSLRADVLTVDAIVQRFADYRQDYEPDGTQSPRSRNLERWPQSGNLGSDSPELGELDFLRTWLTERLAFLDQTIEALPR